MWEGTGIVGVGAPGSSNCVQAARPIVWCGSGGFNDEWTRRRLRLALRPRPSGIVDDHAAQVSILSGATQADAEVAAGGPAAGQEAYAPAAGRAPERQAPAHAIEALQHGVVRLWLIVAVSSDERRGGEKCVSTWRYGRS